MDFLLFVKNIRRRLCCQRAEPDDSVEADGAASGAASGGKKKRPAAKLDGYSAMLREPSRPAPPPKRLDDTSAEEMRRHEEQVKSTSGSAWNSSGTWQDKSFSSFAKKRLPELFIEKSKEAAAAALKDAKKDAKDLFRFTAAKSCTGDASVIFSRGKKRPGFECTLELEFVGSVDKKVVTGSVTITDMTETSEVEDLEVEVNSPGVSDHHAKALLAVTPEVTRLFLEELNAL